MSAKLERSNGFYFNGNNLVLQADQLLLPNGSATAPSLSFASNPDTGLSWITGDTLSFVIDAGNKLLLSTAYAQFYSTYGIVLKQNTSLITFGASSDVSLGRESANVLIMKNGTAPQTFKLYETYTDANNYERYAFIASGDQLEIQAQTLGTGADNLDIALTPAGTGLVKFGTYGAEVAAVAGYITIKDSLGNLRKLAVIT